ncbi:hypothetical protein B0H14DRAFT_3510526 [Mycena olivaceomarginata]|nr:hypothetical protein B0H14DRAFT_3510526 [Mycena olivaceomarginata]
MTRQHRNPPAPKRKRRRTRAQAREQTRIRRLDPADQICALLAIKEDRARYLQESPGTIYFTGQRDNNGQLIMKWGVTSCLPRRQLEYEECGGGGANTDVVHGVRGAVASPRW